MNNALAALERDLSWLPDWLVSATFIGAVTLLSWWLHTVLFRMVLRITANRSLFTRSLVSRTKAPTRLAFLTLAVALSASAAPLPATGAVFVHQVTSVLLILLIGWVARTTLHIWTTIHLRRFKLEAEDNLLARKHATQSRILQRVAETLIVIVTLSAALMTFDGVRQYGVSLLASAGAAGIVAGLALQPILKNLVAGIQLAITQPIRIDDALLVENEWGNVEEITSTYVVVRLWDWRRLVVPLSYFIEKPFQNWTREGAALIGTVMLYTDFTVPVARLRTKLEEIAHASPLWDGKVVNLQVTDFTESSMQIRMLVSAKNAPRTFDLRCEVREKMIGFLQENFPQALPRTRADLSAPREGENGHAGPHRLDGKLGPVALNG
ncbi:mechanosensitive ion channel family protein [Aureimonas psammosilenae]|uniref:mechanosensitive ion channel family protein n=1 Tax=Aureimonas psammosilenae TaxID=2495496 RepID=UPI0012607F69|nr:mechanosensitive ion channel family protein [Aureimonas psammosilenae]